MYFALAVFGPDQSIRRASITIPPLRGRKEDIQLLVQHFVRVFAERMNRQIEVIPGGIMECLMRHPWTGNIRELENFIERAVILSRGSVLEAPLTDLQLTAETATATTLKDAERAHIISILREADFIIAAAAVRLGVPRSTLFYKMRRLGISVPRAAKENRRQQAQCAATSS